MARSHFLLFVLLFLTAISATASDITVIRAGTLVDVEHGQIQKQKLIFVRGEKIESIQDGSVQIPKDATVIDLSGMTVLPGLIDCHTHLIGRIDAGWAGAPLETSSAEEAFTGVEHARQTLLAGFTSVRDVGTYRAFVDVALRDAINKGIVIGPRMSCAGAYITISSGGGDISGLAPDVTVPRELRFGVANSADEVRARAREILNNGADFIKIIATGAVLAVGGKPGASEYTEAEIRAAVETATEYGTRVAAHAHAANGIKNAIRAGVTSIEHGSYMDDEGIRMMKDHGTFWVADIYNGDWIAAEGKRQGYPDEYLRKNDETTEIQRQAFRKGVAAGVKIAYGTDSGVYPHGMNARQLAYMVRYGMTPMQAIQSATLVAADLIGWKDQVGSLSPGKYADIIAVRGDALADMKSFENVEFVMKGGVVYKKP